MKRGKNTPLPIPMVLFCHYCAERHIDHDEWAVKPHRTHLCRACGKTFRPALVDTVGVLEL